MRYGSDIQLGNNRDLVFLPAGEVATIQGAGLIAQDIAEEASIPRGSVPWDRSAGSSLYSFLNDHEASDEAVIQELERLALKDPRVDASSVKAERRQDGIYHLSFRPLLATTDEALLFDLADMFGGASE